MPNNAQPLRDALRQAQDTLASIDALNQSVPPRVYTADGTRLPNELFELVGVTRLLVSLVGAQQEEIMALKERLGS